MTRKPILQNVLIALIFVCATRVVFAQTTGFTYQGKLTDSGTPQAIYQMEFRLFGSPGGADQIGGTITNPNVTVNQGVFSVNLDFGAPAFSGADRYLQISVRRSAGESFTTLNPRQQITSSPYSIRTLSAAQADVALDSQKLGGSTANQFVQTNDSRLSDSRTPLPGSANYIQNSTTQQTGANFNIDGTGVVGSNFGIGTTAIPRARLEVAGNAVQDLSSGGLVKATALVSITQTQSGQTSVRIVRCFNSVLNSSSGNCGFTPLVAQIAGGFRVDVNFGFTVNDRFVLTNGINMPDNAFFTSNVGAVSFLNATTVRAYVTNGDFFIFIF